MKHYVHQSGPNGCRKNCGCCKEERNEIPNKTMSILLSLTDAAENLLNNADDMDESKNDDGKDWDDYKELRDAVRLAKGVL